MKNTNPSWTEIREYYAQSDNWATRLMLPFVKAIEESRYARGLHAWPSHFDLCITQIPVANAYDGPYLRVSAQKSGLVEFRYIDTHVKADQWHRTVPASEAFARLEKFIDQLHWFVPEPTPIS